MLKKLPQHILQLFLLLDKNGTMPYLVGGCIRDLLMGITPHDYDITVCAQPCEIINICKQASYEYFDIGKKFGTIGVVTEDGVVEVTPYRTESGYADFRHPQNVEFVKDIRLDLCRRDFTINAMAMDAHGNILDFFSGKEDILNKAIRCVGVPQERLCEDALRILRAIRFSSRLGFKIDNSTLTAMRKCKKLLSNISCERTGNEIREIINQKYSFDTLRECEDIIRYIIPNFRNNEFLKQNSGNFILNLFSCMSLCDKTTLEKTSEFLRLSCKEKQKLLNLYEIYNSVTYDKFGKIIFDDTTKLLFIKFAYEDIRDIYVYTASRTSEIENFTKNGIFKVKDLAINGKDIIDLNCFPVAKTGKVLDIVLKNVVCGKIKNNKSVIIDFVKKLNVADFA